MITKGDQSKSDRFLLDVCRGGDFIAYVADGFPCRVYVRSLTACRVLQEYNVAAGRAVNKWAFLEQMLGNSHGFVSGTIHPIKGCVSFIGLGGALTRFRFEKKSGHELCLV